MKQNHTPLPWKIESGTGDFYILYDEKEKVTIGLIGKIENSNNSEISSEERFATADFIVRACNSHYELLDICKSAKKQVEILVSRMIYLKAIEAGEILINHIQEVIEKAEKNL